MPCSNRHAISAADLVPKVLPETLRAAQDEAGIGLPSEVVAAAERLSGPLDAAPEDDLWKNDALAGGRPEELRADIVRRVEATRLQSS
jgi:hypothetical protein